MCTLHMKQMAFTFTCSHVMFVICTCMPINQMLGDAFFAHAHQVPSEATNLRKRVLLVNVILNFKP